MSAESKDNAKAARYWLDDAAKSVRVAKECATIVNDKTLHAKIDKVAATVKDAVEHLDAALNEGKAG